MIFKKTKKAVELTLSNIIGIVLAIIIIVGTGYFFYQVGKLFLTEEGQKSKASLRRLGKEIYEMPEDKYDVPYPAFYLDEGYIMLGFNDDKFGPESYLWVCGGYVFPTGITEYWQINRPDSCGNNPCICVCKRTWGGNKIGPDDCIKESECIAFDRKIKTGFGCEYGVFINGEDWLKRNREIQKLNLYKTKDTIYIDFYDEDGPITEAYKTKEIAKK